MWEDILFRRRNEAMQLQAIAEMSRLQWDRKKDSSLWPCCRLSSLQRVWETVLLTVVYRIWSEICDSR